MIDRVEIENFRSIKHLTTQLKPLTVLVGPNDTGKSSFLDAIRCIQLADLPQSNFSSRAPQNYKSLIDQFRRRDPWRREHDTITIKAYSSLREFTFPHRINIHAYNSDMEPAVKAAMAVMSPIHKFQLSFDGLSMVSRGTAEGSGPPVLEEDGSNLPALLDYLLRKDRQRFFDVVQTMKDLVPGFRDLEIATPTPDQRRIDFVDHRGYQFSADQASAGVRLLLFFVTLAFHPNPPKVILLEEPETGVHPKRLAEVMKYLIAITSGEHGGRVAQVIMTTHSPYLLDHVDLERDQVLVFRRDEVGNRTAEAADKERLQLFLDEFMLGEVWFNQGEEGLVARHS